METHGVSKAMKPPTIPNKNIPHKDFSVFFSPQSLAGFSKSMEEILYLLASVLFIESREFSKSDLSFLNQISYLRNQEEDTFFHYMP